jgi:hypothetical protein
VRPFEDWGFASESRQVVGCWCLRRGKGLEVGRACSASQLRAWPGRQAAMLWIVTRPRLTLCPPPARPRRPLPRQPFSDSEAEELERPAGEGGEGEGGEGEGGGGGRGRRSSRHAAGAVAALTNIVK